MPKIAVILSGCGYLDGAEIREAVIALLALDRKGADVTIFAPDIEQNCVVNHITKEKAENETRNVLIESARIARGNIGNLANIDANNFDALVLPGGFGAALNLSDLAIKGQDLTIIPDLERCIKDFISANKPIGAICISPAVLVAALRDQMSANVTIGDDEDGLIEGLGGTHTSCATADFIFDEEHNIVSCSAYMRDDSLSNIADGIEKLVDKVVKLAA